MHASGKDLFIITVSTLLMVVLLLYLIFAASNTTAGTGLAIHTKTQLLPFLLLGYNARREG